MRSFRKILLSVAAVLAFVFVLNKAADFLYEPAKENLLLTRADLKETKGTVETLLVGTSLVDKGLDPLVIGEKLDTVCFNLGTAAQPLSSSYYIIKDEVKRNPIERVFLGVSVKSLVSDSGYDNTAVKLRIFKQIMTPSVKLQYLLNMVEPNELEQFLFYPASVKDIFDTEVIQRNLEYKKSDDFKNRISHKKAKYTYYGMGFQSSDDVYKKPKKKRMDKSIYWDRENILDTNLDYLMKIIDFCKEKEIELNFVIFPHTPDTAALQGDLSDMDAYLEELCRENGVGLFNYNYTVKEDIYDLLPYDCFQDAKHLNRKGAAIFAELLSEDYIAAKEAGNQ